MQFQSFVYMHILDLFIPIGVLTFFCCYHHQPFPTTQRTYSKSLNLLFIFFLISAKSYEIRISKSLQNIQDDFNSAILVNSSKLKPQQAGTKETFTFSPELFTNGPEHQADGETQRSHRIYVAIRAVDRNSLRSAVSNIAQASLSVPPNSTPVLARDDLILKGVLTAISFIGIICLTIVIIHCTLNRKKRADKRGNETKLL